MSMSPEPILSVRKLRKEFGGVLATDDVSLDLHAGEITVVIGPNGCGKTTFLNLCTGYLAPTCGRIIFEGGDIAGLSPRSIARLGIARAFQLPQLFTEHTVLENLLLASAVGRGFWRPLTPLQRVGVPDDAARLLAMLTIQSVADRSIGSLPEGVRKLVDIAVALALKPRLLFLDEPTSGVSSQDKFGIMDTLVGALKPLGITAVLVEHDMDLVARYADRVLSWDAGRIVADGTPGDVLADASPHRRLVEVSA